MTTVRAGQNADARRDVSNRIAALLALAGVMVSSFILVGQGWGQAKLPRVGILVVDATADAPAAGDRSAVIRRALSKQGWIDGQNIVLEVRNARGTPPRFAEMADELVRLNVDVILADSAPALQAAYAATRTIPIIVNDYTTDPIAAGYANSYSKPGGNVTGVFLDAPAFSGKWLDLLNETVPDLSRVAVLWDPSPGDAHLRALEAISPSYGIHLQVIEVHKAEDIDKAGEEFRDWPQALIILPAPITYAENERLAELAVKEMLPAVSIFPVFAVSGGTFVYGPEQNAVDKRTAVFVTKVLKGAQPSELPIERPATFKLVVNLTSARALGVDVPQSILLRADEVIE